MDSDISPKHAMMGGSIAALTGLLFVATSLHVAKIVKTPHFRVLAFGNAFESVGQLINSALVLASQPLTWIELALFNTFVSFLVQVRFHLTWARVQARVQLLRSILGAIEALLGSSVAQASSSSSEEGYLSSLAILILVWVVIWNAFP
jgi:hypothetical protein